MISNYRESFIVDLGGDPLEFGQYTPHEYDLLVRQKENEWKSRMETAAWNISWLTAPHVKRPVKPKKIFDYARIKADSEQDETEAFEEMFMSSEEKGKVRSKKITDALIKLNEKRHGDKNTISKT